MKRLLPLVLAGALAIPAAVPLLAQGEGLSVRLSLGSEVRVGRPAPELVLPYATAAGPGPADQPFDLRRELGRVVVLVFHSRIDAPEASRIWSDIAGTVPEGIVVAAVTRSPLAEAATFAGANRLGYKFLEDRDGRAATAWSGGPERFSVFVIGRDGVVRYRDDDYRGQSPGNSRLAAAITAAREGTR